MQREHVLVGGAAAVVILVGLVGVLAPGVVATPDEPIREDHLTLRETPITPTNVTEDSVTLEVTNWLSHRGGPSENVTLLVRAIDTDTGLVETTTRRAVGTIDRTGDRPVPTTITVERSGGYRIETLVFVDGERVTRESSSVSGVQALQPRSARTGLRFHSFGSSLPTITYQVADVSDGTVTMNTTAYLTNGGDDPAQNLRLVVRARQVDSNIVADRAVVDVAAVRSGRTITPAATLAVPDNFSYKLDAILLRDDVVVDTETAIANLDPSRNVTTDDQTETDEFDADAFDDGDDPADRPPRTEMDGDDGSGSGPGFGVALALAAIVGAAALFARRTDD